jgi:NitT/TauT family transport system permease protein
MSASLNRPVRRVLAPVLGIVAFLVVWEVFVRVGDVRPFVLRAPSSVLAYLGDNLSPFARASLVTATAAIASIVLAALTALVIGALLASSRWLEEAAAPVLVLVQVTPFVLYITSVYLWLGSSRPTIVFIATLVCIPAVTFATVTGLRSADPAAVELLRSVDASNREVLWRLRLPSALPALFTAARYNVGLALIAVYLTEGGALATRGLGVIGKRAASFNEADPLWATVFCMALLGSLGLLLVGLAERVLLRWHASQRDQQRSSRYRAVP